MEQNITENNKRNVLRFKEDIKKVVEQQKENKKITRTDHSKPFENHTIREGWDILINAQNGERSLREKLFEMYTAYYIVKHYYWIRIDLMNCYINNVIRKAHKASNNFSWIAGIPSFERNVKEYVKKYTEQIPRLYVLVSKDLDPIYGCVQGGHAVAQWLIDHKNCYNKWKNDYLIYLWADINEWIPKLNGGSNWSIWKEPDLANRITAIAVESDGKMFRKLQLLK